MMVHDPTQLFRYWVERIERGLRVLENHADFPAPEFLKGGPVSGIKFGPAPDHLTRNARASWQKSEAGVGQKGLSGTRFPQ